MRIVFIGPPGSGKGTQAERLARYFAIPHISTGEVLRQEVAANTMLGRSVHQFMAEGHLVPDEMISAVVERRINHTDCSRGFLLDGFPRTVNQAQLLHTYLEERGIRVQAAIEFQVKADELIRRLAARGRTDDQPETIRKRIAIYEQEAKPLINYYRRRQSLHGVDAVGCTGDVFRRLLGVIDQILGQFEAAKLGN